MKSLLIIAAESSGAQYAQDLLRNWESEPIDAFGIGDQSMVDLGFHALARAEDLAVVGVQEILANYRKIRRAFYDVLDEVDRRKPSAALLIDYPGFNLRLCKELHARGIKVFYYVSPQLWAWRKGRVKIIQQYVHHMLVLFPFEEQFYRDHGVKVTCVGHPMLDQVDPSLLSNRDLNRSQYGLKEQDFLLGFMPGSRKKEIQLNLPTQIEVARLMFKKYPQMRFVFMVAPTQEKERLLPFFEDVGFPYILIKDDPLRMISLADAILAVSGTATLQVALMDRPMVIMYRVNALTAWIAKLVVTVDFFGLVNVILEREAVPERFQGDASAEKLIDVLESVCMDESIRERQRSSFSELREKLKGGATARVAGILREFLG